MNGCVCRLSCERIQVQFPLVPNFRFLLLQDLCSEAVEASSFVVQHWWSEFNYRQDGILICFSNLMLRTLYGKPMRGGKKHYFLNFCQSAGEDWWAGAVSFMWGQLKSYLFHVDQLILCKVRLFLSCHVFLLPRFSFHFI